MHDNTLHDERGARLNYIRNEAHVGAWVAKHNDKKQWIQVSFQYSTTVLAVMTQGRQDFLQYVSKYQVSYKYGGDTWFYVSSDDGQAIVGYVFIIIFKC